MTTRHTSIRGALLGLLLEHPGSAAELGRRLAARLGLTWRLQMKAVYPILEHLEREGLAVPAIEPRRGKGRRVHVVYQPTPRPRKR